MAIEYTNILNDNSKILSVDKKYSHSELARHFELTCLENDINLLEIKNMPKSMYEITLKFNNEAFKFNTLIKNITGSGWRTKPDIKRVQVSNILTSDPIHLQCNCNNMNIIIGYYNFDNNPIYVVWDAYRYLNHKTIRSCYVTTDSLILGYKKGYISNVNMSQKTWVFTPNNIKRFLNEYINYVRENYCKGGIFNG